MSVWICGEDPFEIIGSLLISKSKLVRGRAYISLDVSCTDSPKLRAAFPFANISPKKMTAWGFSREVTCQLLRRFNSNMTRRIGLAHQLPGARSAECWTCGSATRRTCVVAGVCFSFCERSMISAYVCGYNFRIITCPMSTWGHLQLDRLQKKVPRSPQITKTTHSNLRVFVMRVRE